MCGIKTEAKSRGVEVTELQCGRLQWHDHVLRKDVNDWTQIMSLWVLNIELDQGEPGVK